MNAIRILILGIGAVILLIGLALAQAEFFPLAPPQMIMVAFSGVVSLGTAIYLYARARRTPQVYMMELHQAAWWLRWLPNVIFSCMALNVTLMPWFGSSLPLTVILLLFIYAYAFNRFPTEGKIFLSSREFLFYFPFLVIATVSIAANQIWKMIY